MRSLARVLTLAAAAASVGACGGNGQDDPGALRQGWNAVDGMICADGSPTGIGVSLGSRSRVLVVLSGGGACWDASACQASPGPFGAGEFTTYSAFTAGTILDRTVRGNPFADWTFVFVPYCTGDVHAGGDVTRTYGTHGSWRHHGRANLDAALARVARAHPTLEKIVISGSSAGGFGALLALDLARTRWPATAGGPKAYLVDDSGQTFVGNDLPQSLRDAWWSAWNLGATIGPLCSACQGDLSELWTALHARYPADRLALLTSTQDATMIGFFSPMTTTQFETGVANLAAKIAGIPDAASFRISGTAHALFLAPGSYGAGGTPLLTWLGQEVNDDASWTSVGP